MTDILFLVHRIPYPPNKGDKIRSWHMLRHLAERARVHLGAFVDDPEDFAHQAFLESLCASVRLQPISARSRPLRAARGLLSGEPLSIALFEDATLRRWVDRTVSAEPVGGILAFSSQMAPYALPHLPGRRSVMDFVDLDSDKWAQYAGADGGVRGLIYAREARRLLAFEQTVAARFDASLFVSEEEARLFRSRAGRLAAKVHALSNGVDLEYFRPDADFPVEPFEGHDLTGPLLVFVGAMDYKPNADAVQWFATEVLPRVRASQPRTRFLIVGSKPTAEVQALEAREGITVTGRVDDIRPYVAGADLVVAPLRIARGIQNKVLEAMAMGKAVVATPQAFEGIVAEPGRDLVVEGEAGATASIILSLLADPARAAEIGIAARAAMVERYEWSTNLALLDNLLLDGMRKERAAA